MRKSFDKLTEAALNKILFVEYEELNDFNLSKYENGQATIVIGFGTAFEQRLIFYNAQISERVEVPGYYSDFHLIEQEDGYCLEFRLPYESGDQASYKMFFSTVNVEIQCFNYTKTIIPYYEPWHLLTVFLYEMRNKRDQLGVEYLNEEEKKILPLSDFIPLKQYFNKAIEDIVIFEAKNNTDTEVLKIANDLFINFAERAQIKEIEMLAREYAELPIDSKNKNTVSRKLQRAFTSIKGEPLYQLILKEIKRASARYHDRIEIIGKGPDADKMRERISAFFGSQGFEETYPSFQKKSSFIGPRMIRMENPADIEIFWHEKNMVSLVDCFEDCINGELTVSYVAGTVLLKKDQKDLYHSLAAYSGFFKDKKNRRRGRVIINQTCWNDSEYLSIQDENLKAAEIASKVSQCKRVTKEERKEYLSLDSHTIEVNRILIIVSLLVGLLFGSIMCAGLALMAIVVGWIIEGRFPTELILDVPWHLYFLFCSISSGIAMFLITSIGGKRG